jgi:MoxR-like ATPase
MAEMAPVPMTAARIETTAAETERLLAAAARLTAEIGKVIVGQSAVVNELLVALFAGGHALLVGVPGLAKTVLVKTLASATHLKFSRIQFTPDLLPSDVTGSEVLEEGAHGKGFRFLEGPVFTNLLLADEINRTAPKTQAALLEAMQERQVSAGGKARPLPAPFCVLATQNPIEQEGTFPLPEAQLDRFLLQIDVPYPPLDEEIQILHATTARAGPEVDAVLSGDDVIRLQALVREVAIAPDVVAFAARLVRATRPGSDGGIAELAPLIEWGAGPRAGQALVLAGKARALLSGRFAVATSDILALAAPVLRHRLVLSAIAHADGVAADEVVERLVKKVPRP